MRIVLIAALVFLILAGFVAPVFYEAYMEHRVLKVSRHVASDLMLARALSIKSGRDYGIFLKRDEPGYLLFIDDDRDGKLSTVDKVLKRVRFRDIAGSVKMSSDFDDKDVVFMNDTFVFRGDGKLDQSGATGHDSVFLVNSSDEEKTLKDRIIRVYVDRSNNDVQILRVTGRTDQGDLVFGEIIS